MSETAYESMLKKLTLVGLIFPSETRGIGVSDLSGKRPEPDRLQMRTATSCDAERKTLAGEFGKGMRVIFGDQTQSRYSEREGVLDEAKTLVTGDRNAAYGPPTQDFGRTADMMTALFSSKLKEGERFKPSDVAWIITLVKASRARHSPKRDNYVDAAGYMACGWECEAEENKIQGEQK